MPPHIQRRGLQDIRTNAGRVTAPGSRQRAYLRLCTLEMERQRREQEYKVASQQAAISAERARNLASEMNEIIASLPHSDRARLAPSDPQQTSQQQSAALDHRYGPRNPSPSVHVKRITPNAPSPSRQTK